MHCGRMLGRYSDYMKKNMQEHLEQNTTSEYCYECRSKGYVKSSYIMQGKSLYLYRGAIKETMYRFKYSNRRDYARVFARYAVQKYGEWIAHNHIQVIVPVPMFWLKQKKRGYNQAESFARELSLLTGVPMEKGLIKRIKDTTPQKELNDVERKNNLKNAFQNVKSIVQYSHVLVVDDIYTTGSTAQAVAKELIKQGVRHVYFMSICIGGDM